MSEEKLKLATEARESGNKYFKEHNYVVALDEYTKSIEFQPSPQSLSNRAFCYIKLDQFGAALTDAEQALAIDPNFTKV
jgi:serine/threonine-protein phosphatase 5